MTELEDLKEKNKELESDKEILKDKLDDIYKILDTITFNMYKIEEECNHKEI